MRGSVQNSSQEAAHQANEIEFEDFDLLVVASGYFARPYAPKTPGLKEFKGQVIHSSVLEKGRASLSADTDITLRGHTVVIGGSMSGVEAASALALRESSSRISTNPATASSHGKNKVYHIHSRPFWTLPTYLPCETSDETVSFLPLDLAMYDLSRRPPGPVEYNIGPLSDEKIEKTNGYFRSLLGAEYEKYGHSQQQSSSTKPVSQPEWVAIGNDYAEFVRSGGIEAVMGRVTSIHPQSDPRTASINIKTAEDSQTLDNVTSIVMATGFTPFDSLSFLPEDVRSSLEYNADDPFLPLILDKGGTSRSEIPDLGFVGFYRGPYWGVMEMQAKFLGKEWAKEHDASVGTELETKDQSQRELLRNLRQPSTEARRGQFFMGDYVGLMETFAKDLEIERLPLSDDESRSGPVIPARYAQEKEDGEGQHTLDSLRAMLRQDHPTVQAAASLAVFRALHGTWTFTRTSVTGERAETGTVAFILRYSSNPIYDREYVLETRQEAVSAESQASSVGVTVFRLSEASTGESSSRIGVYHVTTDGDRETDQLAHRLHLTSFYRGKEAGEYVIHAKSIHSNATDGPTARQIQYSFHFKGVSITEWECFELEDSYTEGSRNIESQAQDHWRTVYKR
ncbi:FAD-dependent pyridine nucleotide-disulfide oxidoreductase [Penicillium subrubescens]|uniref:FAD-dependent pyridine nucleotide-disulfide oxidoreductase n=1 Tax=Penicillium subrubescens TaxID=1316194 RepID=UPI0025452A03|nr:FAD-dependent pyridine nucleotide-disulfide oxidoreductase [Penicillium subrubescens]KAJ5883604.1 FAD-dependent pyridine nucleotide-disulfide oxidoreductase [Penicillium subrubescens]